MLGEPDGQPTLAPGRLWQEAGEYERGRGNPGAPHNPQLTASVPLTAARREGSCEALLVFRGDV